MANPAIRVLLVDDIPEVRENVRKLLYFEKDIEVVGMATHGEEAITQARELEPDVVLMDINMPGMDGITASEAITAESPHVQIIMMSVQGETDYLRRSMLAGAKGFLIKPFGSDEMISTIRNVDKLAPPREPEPAVPQTKYQYPQPPPTRPVQRRKEGSVIAIFSPKGGVGCSLVATNLAIALRGLAEEKTALMDCSLQFGDVGVLLNQSASHTIAELAGKLGKVDPELLDVVLTPHLSGVKVLLAPAHPEEADLISADLIREVLGLLKSTFTYVVVDTSSALQDHALAIFDMADRILLITTPDIPSIKSARLFFDVTEALDYPEERIKLILNQADRQNPIGPKDISAGIKHPVYLAIPADRRAAYTSVNQGSPCVMSNRGGPIAQAVIKLAQSLADELHTPEMAEEPQERKAQSGILARLLKR